MDVEGGESGTAGNQDGFRSLAGSQLVKFVLPTGKGVGLLFCQFFKQQIHRVLVFLVILQHLHGVHHLQQSSEVLLLHRGFIVQIGNQGGEQKTLRFFPEWVPAGPFPLGVGHQGCDQFQNVLFAVDIGEGVIVHGLFEVDGVQDIGRSKLHQMTHAPAYQITVALKVAVLTVGGTEDFGVGHGNRGLFCYN